MPTLAHVPEGVRIRLALLVSYVLASRPTYAGIGLPARPAEAYKSACKRCACGAIAARGDLRPACSFYSRGAPPASPVSVPASVGCDAGSAARHLVATERSRPIHTPWDRVPPGLTALHPTLYSTLPARSLEVESRSGGSRLESPWCASLYVASRQGPFLVGHWWDTSIRGSRAPDADGPHPITIPSHS